MPVYPFNIQLGPLQVTGYGIMMMVSFLTVGWLIMLELQRRGLSRDYASYVVMAALVGGSQAGRDGSHAAEHGIRPDRGPDRWR